MTQLLENEDFTNLGVTDFMNKAARVIKRREDYKNLSETDLMNKAAEVIKKREEESKEEARNDE